MLTADCCGFACYNNYNNNDNNDSDEGAKPFSRKPRLPPGKNGLIKLSVNPSEVSIKHSEYLHLASTSTRGVATKRHALATS